MMFFPCLIAFVALLTQGATAVPREAAAVSLNNTSVSYGGGEVSASGNATFDQRRAELLESVRAAGGCDVAYNFQAATFVECTEWCDIKDNTLRYHVKLTGTGQEEQGWCDTLQRAVNLHCGGTRPFWNCNWEDPTSRAKPDERLGTFLVNGWTNKVEYYGGINARFDWWGGWDPSDAMHGCVERAIQDSTCHGIEFSNGLHCIPVNYVEPDDGRDNSDEFVAPENCYDISQVPEEAR